MAGSVSAGAHGVPTVQTKAGQGGGTSPGSTSIPTFARRFSLVLLSVSNSSQFTGFSNQLRGCKSRHGYSSGQAARLRARARPQRSPTSVIPPTPVNACARLSPWARPFLSVSSSSRTSVFQAEQRGCNSRHGFQRAEGGRYRSKPAVAGQEPHEPLPRLTFAARAGHRRGSYPRARWFDSIGCDDAWY